MKFVVAAAESVIGTNFANWHFYIRSLRRLGHYFQLCAAQLFTHQLVDSLLILVSEAFTKGHVISRVICNLQFN
jgi:hypothetical protein